MTRKLTLFLDAWRVKMSRIIATLILFTSLLSNVTQSAADTDVCEFGEDKDEFSFYRPYNCKNGDTAIH